MAILGVEMSVPDHSTLSRLACGWALQLLPRRDSDGLGHAIAKPLVDPARIFFQALDRRDEELVSSWRG
jgi:hypothetical protein